MKHPRHTLLTLIILLSTCRAGRAEGFLDKVIERPGGFDQMCSMPSFEPDKLSLFVPVGRHETFVSDSNIAILRAHRAEVIPDLVKQVAQFNSLDTAPKFNELFYKVIPSLNAVETLPDLLGIEDKLRQIITTLENDPKAPAPEVSGGPMMILDAKSPPDVSPQRRVALVMLRVRQRELLSVMLQILRGQHYTPLLDSQFETLYEAAIRKRALEADFKDMKTPEQAKDKGVPFDPICKLPVAYMYPPPSVPYSDAVATQIRDLARQFIKDVPPAKWKLDAG